VIITAPKYEPFSGGVSLSRGLRSPHSPTMPAGPAERAPLMGGAPSPAAGARAYGDRARGMRVLKDNLRVMPTSVAGASTLASRARVGQMRAGRCRGQRVRRAQRSDGAPVGCVTRRVFCHPCACVLVQASRWGCVGSASPGRPPPSTCWLVLSAHHVHAPAALHLLHRRARACGSTRAPRTLCMHPRRTRVHIGSGAGRARCHV